MTPEVEMDALVYADDARSAASGIAAAEAGSQSIQGAELPTAESGKTAQLVGTVRRPVNQDYTTESVPLTARRDPVTMGLLWITMVTGFPSVLVGFDWYKSGLSLPQVIGCSIVSCLILMLYCLPSCFLGARSGLTYALLSRKVFGRWGSWFVSLNLVWVCIAWYGLTAVFLADGLRGLYPNIPLSPFVFAVGLAVVMAFNNFFGFSGVANFARYLAGPMLVVWVFFTFYKACGTCPPAVWQSPSHIPNSSALMMVSSFVIGYSVWGNEADYWRFGKPSRSHIMLPLLVSVMIGELIFPVTGWLLAYMTKIDTYAGATALMNNYAFGGMSIIAALVLIISYVAVNDSSLYGAINALQNIAPVPRKRMVAGLAILGSVTAGVLSGMTKNFEDVASLSCVVLPSATVIILTELFLVSKEHKSSELSRVLPFEQLPKVRWSAVLALIAGCGTGVVTSGLFPGCEMLHVGVPALQAWAVSLGSYLVLRRFDP
jgi:purine-cytosine permease-like protein